MENVSERGMALLVECIRAASEDARLLSKTALQQAFEESWRSATAPACVTACVPNDALSVPDGAVEATPGDVTSGERASESTATTNTLSRRALLTSLLGAPQETVVAEAAVPATPGPAEPLSGAEPLSEAEPLPDFEPLLAAALAATPDLAVVTLAGSASGEEAYHFLPLLSATYAGILAGRDDPAQLMAATVRENSRDYPRPVPLDLFEYPPFDYSPEQVQTSLKTLADDPACADIRMVESSVGTVYLYSSLYLEHDYAEFLADREDVGLVLNP